MEAAVIGLPDVDFGEAVHAFVVLKEGSAANAASITAYCADRLARYKVPKRIEFLDELPKNTTGKILRRSLKDQVKV